MSEKISTIVLKVDLDCCKCSKKIRKTICKLQERESIQTVSFDEKNNTVTISGLFDPKKLCKKLCCKACKVIKDIQIKEEKPLKPPKPNDNKPPDIPVVKPPPRLCFQPGWPWPWPGPGCICGCMPWYGGYYGDYKCPWCGRGYGWPLECPPPVIYAAPPPPPPPQPCGGYKTCTFICEEDPQFSCGIM